MKKLLFYSAATLIISQVSVAQNISKDNVEKGEMKIVVVNDEDGKITRFDSTFSINDKEQVEQLLKEKGIDLKMDFEGDQIHVEGKGNQKIIINKEIKGEGEVDKQVKVIRLNSSDEAVNDQEIEVMVKALKGEMDQIKHEMSFSTDEGNTFTFKSNENLSEEELNALKEKLGKEGGKVMVKTIVIEDDGEGKIEERVFTFSTNSMVFFVSDDKVEANEELLPTEIVEEDLKSLEIKELKLFPNPSNGNFNMSFESKSRKNFNISITDTKGAIIYNKALSNFKGKFNEDFDLSGQEPGLYFFNINSGEAKETKKIILK